MSEGISEEFQESRETIPLLEASGERSPIQQTPASSEHTSTNLELSPAPSPVANPQVSVLGPNAHLQQGQIETPYWKPF